MLQSGTGSGGARDYTISGDGSGSLLFKDRGYNGAANGTGERMRITYQSTVGINTSSPGTAFHVNGGAMLDGITVIGRYQTTYDSSGAEVLIDANASTPPMAWHVGGSEVARIDANGAVTITDNLVFSTAGKGVYLGVTSATAANHLDDYEEGTFTATLTGSTTAPTTPVTVTAYYVKIGRIVTFDFAFSNVTPAGAAGILQITGMPFTSAAQTSVGAQWSHGGNVGGNHTVWYLSGTTLTSYNTVNAAAWTANGISTAAQYQWHTGTYRTAA